jgi:Ca2+-transporting ATPase
VTALKAPAQPHALDAEAVAAVMEVRPEAGLSAADALERLSRMGPNRLPQPRARSPWNVLLAQFKSILTLILIGAVVLASLVGSTKDAAVILAVVVVNALVGFYQEYRAERSLAALKLMLPQRARVRRSGVSQEISADDVVPGDVLLLEAGDRVPADARLWLVAGLEIDESALTGESQPVGKHVHLRVAADAPLGDRLNLVYMNTLLTRGRAEAVVTATGTRTEMGRLSLELAATEEVATPLQVQLDRLGKRLGAIALTLVGLLSFLQFMRGADLVHIVLDAIALSVAAMPEGLPVVVTVTLALGMHKIARQHAIVKRLASVETLGCTTVICSDKTGTLTLNQMTVRSFVFGGERYSVTGEGYSTQGEIRLATGHEVETDLAPLLVPMVACNDSRVDEGRAIGDPMEAALLVLAAKGGVVQSAVARALPRVAELPFDSAHKFMATFHREGDRIEVFVKGAPDVLLARCSRWKAAGVYAAFGAPEAGRVDADYRDLAKHGLRGLLIASRTLSAETFDPSGDLSRYVSELDFVGLVGLMDPPRPEARQAIEESRRAGIVVKMITGDHQATASAIAAELGLHGRTASGAEIDRMDAAQLAAAIEDVAVFARVTPSHKVRIVRALQARGHVVAMTGDGVNDAPALKQANIGVAMGITGTAVAKEAATMVLTDDNFATIVRAVRQGRTLYDNILKFVRFQLSTTIGAILTVFFAPLAGLPEPFTALQILWVAIIMDGPPAVSLAMDSARPGIMKEPPRHRDESVLPLGRVLRLAAYGVTMMVGTLAVLYYALRTGSEERALTLAFSTFVLFQFFNVFNCRAEVGSAFNRHFFDNPMLWLSLVATLALQAVAVHWMPASQLFGTTGMSLPDWAIAIGVASTVLLFEETRKLAARAFHSRSRSKANDGRSL